MKVSIGEKHTDLPTMLDVVQGDCKDEKCVVGFKDKADFRLISHPAENAYDNRIP